MTASTASTDSRLLPPPAPWVAPDATLAAPNPAPPPTAWMLHASEPGGKQLVITSRDIRYGDATIDLGRIENVAFLSTRRTHHHVVIAGSTDLIRVELLSNGFRRRDPHRRAYLELVKVLESRVFPRLIQHRLQRIDVGLTVSIGKLELRATGLRSKTLWRSREAQWVDFDHCVLARNRILVMTRTPRGKHRVLAEVRLDEMNAVLLPALLPAACSAFGRSATQR